MLDLLIQCTIISDDATIQCDFMILPRSEDVFDFSNEVVHFSLATTGAIKECLNDLWRLSYLVYRKSFGDIS